MESIQTGPFPPVSDLIEPVVEGGGSINGCGTSPGKRGLKEGGLSDGAHVVGAACLIVQMEGAKVLSYAGVRHWRWRLSRRAVWPIRAA